MEVKKNGVTIAQFTYDGDGKRVKSVVNGETTLFVGSYYEQKGSQVTKYYTSTCSVQASQVPRASPHLHLRQVQVCGSTSFPRT